MSKMSNRNTLVLLTSFIIISSTIIVGFIVIHSPIGNSRLNFESVEQNNTTKTSSNLGFNYLKFDDQYQMPRTPNQTIQSLRINNLNLNNTTAVKLLKQYKFLHIDNDTIFQNGTNALSVFNKNVTSSVYFNGIVDISFLNCTYSLSTKTQIDNSTSLLNRTEALEKTSTFLKGHNISVSSWKLIFNKTLIMTYVVNNTSLIKYYTFKYVPIVTGLPLYVPSGPSVTMDVNPKGEVIRCIVNTRQIIPSNLTLFPRYKSPVMALIELDNNHSNYFSTSNVTIKSMSLCYSLSSKDMKSIIPCWIVYYGTDKSSYRILE